MRQSFMAGAASQFFEQPILNAPYDYPGRHWELDPGSPEPAQKV